MSNHNIAEHIRKIASLPFINEKQRMRRLCIYLILGMDCNMGCTYCFHKSRVNNIKDVDVTDAFINFLKIELPSKIPQGMFIPIQFWGGEPLMYMDKIKYIVEHIKHLNCYKLLIVSNGSLLDASIVKFCNSHNIGVGISHDGPNTIGSRGYDVVMTKYELINDIENFLGFSSVLSEHNYCVDAITTYFSNNNLLDERHRSVRIYPAIPTDKQQDVNIDIIRDNTKRLLVNLDQKLRARIPAIELGMLEGSIANYMLYKMQPNIVHDINNSMRVNMTVDGKLFYTHGAEFELGDINTSLAVLYDKYRTIRRELFKKWEECELCTAFSLCMGGQLVGIRAGERLCETNKAYYGTIYEFMRKMDL